MPNNFIEKYLKYTEIYESPGSFWKWSAYAAVAAVLRDHCYKGQGDSRLFTNIYVLFLAESGGRKGKPVDMCESLVFRVNNTKIISGRASIQGILDELSRAETDKITGKINKAGSAIFFAQELAAGIVGDPEAINILTDIYDYKSNSYKSRLRTGPCFNLERIVFSMLTASNEDMLKGFFDDKAKKGGLLARTFLIVPNEQREPNSLMDVDIDERQQAFKGVFGSFKELSNLQGEYTFTEKAKDEYKAWYNPFYKSYQMKKEVTGAVSRIHTGILKIAMILAANELSLTVEKWHIEKAIEDCTGLLPNYAAFIMGNGKSTISAAGQIVLMELYAARNFTMSRKALLQGHWNDFDGETLDKLICTFEQAGLVWQQICPGKDTMYALTQAAIDTLKGSK